MTTRAVGVDEVVVRYHERVSTTTTTVEPVSNPGSITSTSAAAASASGPVPTEPVAEVRPPASGVYRYATTGSESIDALGGAVHDYPSETTITVTPHGCGVHLQWDALHERRDEWVLCLRDGDVVLEGSRLQYHEFFGQGTMDDIECAAVPLVLGSARTTPVAIDPECTMSGSPWPSTWTRLGSETRTVGSTVVTVHHVRMTVDQPGDHHESTTVDWWLTDGGLPVEVGATKESVSGSPIGDVTYREAFTLELRSLDPLG